MWQLSARLYVRGPPVTKGGWRPLLGHCLVHWQQALWVFAEPNTKQARSLRCDVQETIRALACVRRERQEDLEAVTRAA